MIVDDNGITLNRMFRKDIQLDWSVIEHISFDFISEAYQLWRKDEYPNSDLFKVKTKDGRELKQKVVKDDMIRTIGFLASVMKVNRFRFNGDNPYPFRDHPDLGEMPYEADTAYHFTLLINKSTCNFKLGEESFLSFMLIPNDVEWVKSEDMVFYIKFSENTYFECFSISKDSIGFGYEIWIPYRPVLNRTGKNEVIDFCFSYTCKGIKREYRAELLINVYPGDFKLKNNNKSNWNYIYLDVIDPFFYNITFDIIKDFKCKIDIDEDSENEGNRFKLKPILDLEVYAWKGEISAFNISFKGEYIFVQRLPVMENINNSESGACITGAIKKNTYGYRIFISSKDNIYHITDIISKDNFEGVLLFNDNTFLLVAAEAFNNEEFCKNAKLYNFKGELLNEYFVCDDLRAIQSTVDDNIWVNSYLEDSIDRGFAKSDLNYYNRDGKPLKFNRSDSGLPSNTYECTGINLDEDNTIWFAYEDTLIKTKNGERVDYWTFPIGKYTAFAVYGDYVLIAEGSLVVVHLGPNHKGEIIKIISPDRDGDCFDCSFMFGRRDRLYGMLDENNPKVYCIKVRDFLEEALDDYQLSKLWNQK